jgi:hypothetical protein
MDRAKSAIPAIRGSEREHRRGDAIGRSRPIGPSRSTTHRSVPARRRPAHWDGRSDSQIPRLEPHRKQRTLPHPFLLPIRQAVNAGTNYFPLSLRRKRPPFCEITRSDSPSPTTRPRARGSLASGARIRRKPRLGQLAIGFERGGQAVQLRAERQASAEPPVEPRILAIFPNRCIRQRRPAFSFNNSNGIINMVEHRPFPFHSPIGNTTDNQ